MRESFATEEEAQIFLSQIGISEESFDIIRYKGRYRIRRLR